jgi:hypothetical protein
MRKQTVPTLILVIIAALGISVLTSACGSESTTDKQYTSSENQSNDELTETAESDNGEEYREFNSSDFKGRNFFISSIKNNEDFQKQLQDGYDSDTINSQFISTIMNKYVFSSATEDDEYSVDIIELGYVGKSALGQKLYYYKITVKDIDSFKYYLGLNDTYYTIDTDGWSADDEIYMVCDYGYPEDELEVGYYLKNYSVQ